MSFQREFKLNEMVAFCQVHIIKNWRTEEEKTTNFDDILSIVWYTFNYLDKSSDERYLKYFVISLKELHSTQLSRPSLKPRNNVVLPEIYKVSFGLTLYCFYMDHVWRFMVSRLTVMVFTRYPVFTWKFLLFFSNQKKMYM